jgi:hypothetical protein
MHWLLWYITAISFIQNSIRYPSRMISPYILVDEFTGDDQDGPLSTILTAEQT